MWAYPVFPSNLSLVGSVPTPYIFDDRAEPFDIADQIKYMYLAKTEVPDMFARIGELAREWVTSDESMMSARWMSKNVISAIDETFEKWTPRYQFEFIPVEPLKQPKHFVKHVIAK